MVKRLERMGERALSIFVPRATAGAFCLPQQYCQWCPGGKTQWVNIMADCSVSYSACVTNLCR